MDAPASQFWSSYAAASGSSRRKRLIARAPLYENRQGESEAAQWTSMTDEACAAF